MNLKIVLGSIILMFPIWAFLGVIVVQTGGYLEFALALGIAVTVLITTFLGLKLMEN